MLFRKPDILNTIEDLFKLAIRKQWYHTYWAFDLHQTILKPDYKREGFSCDFYPYALETLQILSKRDDIVMILYTATPPDIIKIYLKEFENKGIKFKYINCNPDVDDVRSFGYYKEKFYFNALFEDKSGFNPKDWKTIYKWLSKKLKTYNPDPKWDQKF